jgi:hypothetical protein
MPKFGQPREVVGTGRLKGGIFRSHMQWVKDNRSPADLQKLLDRLPPDAKKELGAAILATSWYPFAWLMALDRAIADLFGGGRGPEMLRELGKYSALINLSTTYKLLDRKANHEFFRNSALLHAQFQDFGKVQYQQTGESSLRMIHTGYQSYSPTFCASALGYYEGCVESHGGASPAVTESECQCYGDPSCTFEISWR